jgi:hypothetical protein
MRKLAVIVAASAALMLAGAIASYAQTTRGALSLPAASKDFTPIEKAACGPYAGRFCGPYHHRVCRYGRCWCAHC